MNLKVEILKVKDKVVLSEVWKGWDYNEFWWREGNASCDCNRELFFYNIMNKEAPDNDCTSGRYLVRLSNDDTNAILYNEIDT